MLHSKNQNCTVQRDCCLLPAAVRDSQKVLCRRRPTNNTGDHGRSSNRELTPTLIGLMLKLGEFLDAGWRAIQIWQSGGIAANTKSNQASCISSLPLFLCALRAAGRDVPLATLVASCILSPTTSQPHHSIHITSIIPFVDQLGQPSLYSRAPTRRRVAFRQHSPL